MLAATDVFSVLAAIAALITAVAVFITAALLLRKVDAVHAEVRTANGLSIGALSDREEGRRIIEQIAKKDRTTSEQGYVDKLESGGRNIGHEGIGDVTHPPETNQ